ncbi:hypothetical protein U27_04380 [Candidatus Vecturithrix granuli]|uniref:DUF2723 domain-containing protein n=1 Tax=Vecturithrix granuli TaxID=1499967 RepID=A0A081BYK8_VECG1|nr:hypothetical protein U27_04380 [Candidatus Vecturithrix granuli]
MQEVNLTKNSGCFRNFEDSFPQQRNRTMKKLQLNYLPYQIYAGFAGMVVFWVYVQTLAPTVSFFDSGELIAAAYTLGVAHPPGYPLYVLLGWVFSKLPFGEGAYRLNLMSACFSTLAALMVFLITHLILAVCPQTTTTESSRNTPDPEQIFIPIISLIAALIFAFARTPWSQALIAEVYSLNAFLCGTIIWLLLRWRRAIVGQEDKPASSRLRSVNGNPNAERSENPDVERSRDVISGTNVTTPVWEGKGIPKAWLLYLVAFLFGIGFGNHQTISLFFFAACFVVLMTTPRILFKAKTVALILVWLMLGFSIYVLPPIRAAQNPPINWGNPSSWQQFKWLVTREGYNNVPRGGSFIGLWQDLRHKTVTEHDVMAGQSPIPDRQVHGFARSVHILRSSLFFRQLATFHPQQEFGVIGVILAILGLLYGIVRYRIPTLTLLIAIGAFILLTIFVSDPPEENIFLVEEFHTPAYLLTAVLIGLGLMGLARWMLWVARPWKILCYGLVLLLSLMFLLIPGSLMLRHVREVDRSRNYVAYDYASNVLMSLQPNAILFTWGDSGAFPLWYLQIVEKKRPDVILIHVPHLSSPWYLESLPAELSIVSETTPEQQKNILAMVDAIVQRHQGLRPIYFDFSSAHSIMVPTPPPPAEPSSRRPAPRCRSSGCSAFPRAPPSGTRAASPAERP